MKINHIREFKLTIEGAFFFQSDKITPQLISILSVMSLSHQDQKSLQIFLNFCKSTQYDTLGYPAEADFNYKEIEVFFQFSINNCGDWAEKSNYHLNTFAFEKEVMVYFAEKFSIPFSNAWGYVTNGGTEGNMYGCYLARERFPNGILYFSEDTHYSVAKIVKLLRIEHKVIKSKKNGEMDYSDFEKQISLNKKNPIVFVNVGTTLYGATDNLDTIKVILKKAKFTRDEYHLHIDAAFHGMILPFVDTPQPHSFSDGIDSISISGHKMIGSPIPCGIVLTKKEYVENVTVEVDYIVGMDKTIAGSRNGLTPLILWYAIKSSSEQEKILKVKRCLNLAEYIVDKLKEKNVPAWRHHNSLTVVFPTPSESIWREYGLAHSGKNAHLIIAGHLINDTARLEGLIDAIAAEYLPQKVMG